MLKILCFELNYCALKVIVRTILLFFFVILSVQSYGQKNDFIGWTSIGLEKKINKKISIEGEFQLRYNNNARNLNGYYYSADFKYKVNKKWRALLQSRYKASNDQDVLRLGGGLNYDFKIKNLKIDIRQLYQADIRMYKLSGDFNHPIRHQLRSRLKFDYELNKKLNASLSPEAYWRFDEGELYLARMRYSIGLDYEFINNTNVQIQYLVQPNYHPAGFLDELDYILSLGLNWKI